MLSFKNWKYVRIRVCVCGEGERREVCEGERLALELIICFIVIHVMDCSKYSMNYLDDHFTINMSLQHSV